MPEVYLQVLGYLPEGLEGTVSMVITLFRVLVSLHLCNEEPSKEVPKP